MVSKWRSVVQLNELNQPKMFPLCKINFRGNLAITRSIVHSALMHNKRYLSLSQVINQIVPLVHNYLQFNQLNYSKNKK